MSTRNAITLQYKDQDILALFRKDPTLTCVEVSEILRKKYGHGSGQKHVMDLKRIVLKEIGYTKPKPRYDKVKKPKTSFWDT